MFRFVVIVTRKCSLHCDRKKENTGLVSEHFYKINTCSMGSSRPSSLTEYVNIHNVTIEK